MDRMSINGYHSVNMPSTSSSPYPDFSHPNPTVYPLPQQLQPSLQSQPINPMANQWAPPIHPNSFPHAPLHSIQQSQPFNTSWSQIPSQSFPNAMPNIGAFNLPFLSQQILQDALSMSEPVKPSDENTLLQALIESRNKRETYKDALNSLHGKNGHAASLWKDYYLDHKDRLDEAVSLYLNTARIPIQTAKKPSPHDFKPDNSPVPLPRAFPKRRRTSVEKCTPPSVGGRTTINSITAPAPIFSDRLPPPNADIQVPEPPLRSPTPPSVIVSHQGRGNKFTPQDQDFFLKFISWRLKADPFLTRQDLCVLLAEKAPHHTSQSWASYWSNRHDLPDKILAAAKGDQSRENDKSESEETEEKIFSKRRPTYRDPSSSEEDEGNNITEEEGDELSDTVDDEPLQTWSESEMGPRGGSFTAADLYITAKYITSFAGWDEASGKERWQPYSERFPQRSAKSWAEYYRRYENKLRKLAKKIKRESAAKKESSSIQFQRARPTWASVNGNDPPQIKRKYGDAGTEEGEEGTSSRSKRGKGENSNT